MMKLLDNEAIELEFISVLVYYTYKRKLEKEESMMCRNDKGRVDPKWKTQQVCESLSHNACFPLLKYCFDILLNSLGLSLSVDKVTDKVMSLL